MARETRIYGLDGCRAGWVAASGSADRLELVTFALVPDQELRSFLEPVVGTGAVVAIDVPIGLAESDARACDRAARVRLGFPRQNSVFSAPCRGTLAAADYVQACTINRDLRGRAVSLQTWGIVGKIAAVDALLEELPRLAAQMWEAHPEVTFAELAGTQRGLSSRKKSADGRLERLALLEAHGLQLDLERVHSELRSKSLDGVRTELRGGSLVPDVARGAARDDIVDAAACLLTAARLARGQATFLPPGAPPCDARRRRMQIAA